MYNRCFFSLKPFAKLCLKSPLFKISLATCLRVLSSPVLFAISALVTVFLVSSSTNALTSDSDSSEISSSGTVVAVLDK